MRNIFERLNTLTQELEDNPVTDGNLDNSQTELSTKTLSTKAAPESNYNTSREERNKKIIERWEEGNVSLAELVYEFSRSDSTIQNILTQNGYKGVTRSFSPNNTLENYENNKISNKVEDLSNACSISCNADSQFNEETSINFENNFSLKDDCISFGAKEIGTTFNYSDLITNTNESSFSVFYPPEELDTDDNFIQLERLYGYIKGCTQVSLRKDNDGTVYLEVPIYDTSKAIFDNSLGYEIEKDNCKYWISYKQKVIDMF